MNLLNELRDYINENRAYLLATLMIALIGIG